MVDRAHVGHTRQPAHARVWRVWFVGFVIAVVSATAVSAASHAEHDSDQNCIVCKLRNQPLAELTGDLQVAPAGTPEPATRASATPWIPPDADAQVPARAPPSF